MVTSMILTWVLQCFQTWLPFGIQTWQAEKYPINVFFTWKIIYKFKWFSIAMFDYQRVIAIWFNRDKHGDINEWAPYPATTIQKKCGKSTISTCKLSKNVGTTGFSTSMTNLWHGDIKEEYGWKWGSWQLIRINKVCQGITNKLGIFSRDISSNIEIPWDNPRGFTRQIRVGVLPAIMLSQTNHQVDINCNRFISHLDLLAITCAMNQKKIDPGSTLVWRDNNMTGV